MINNSSEHSLNENFENNFNTTGSNFNSINNLRYSSSGIKFLLNIRNLKTEDLENDEFVKENKRLIQEENPDEIMGDESYKKNIDEMDNFIKDILKTKQELKMEKLKETVKTREDILNFYEIKQIKNHNFSPEPIDKDINYLKNLSNINNNELQKKNIDFQNMKNIINEQNNLLKDLEDHEKSENDISIKKYFFPTEINKNNIYFTNKKSDSFDNFIPYLDNNKRTLINSISTSTCKDNKNFKFANQLVNKNSYNLTDEEREFMNKYVYNSYNSDDLIEEIDDCIKIGEEIDDIINYIEH